MKKFIIGLLTGMILATGTLAFAASSDIKLKVNGQYISFPDAPPQIINGRTMVPARPLAEALGATVEWDAATKTVVVSNGSQPISLDDHIPYLDIGKLPGVTVSGVTGETHYQKNNVDLVIYIPGKADSYRIDIFVNGQKVESALAITQNYRTWVSKELLRKYGFMD